MSQSLIMYLKQLGPDGNQELLRRVQAVTKEDVYQAFGVFLKPLFDPKVTNCGISTNPSKVPEIVKAFASKGRVLEATTVEKFFK